MIRTILILIALVAGLSACSRELPEATQALRGGGALITVQLAQKTEITVDKILADIVGKNVTAQDVAGESQPMDWVFEADEPKTVEILEQKPKDTSISLVVQMNTSGAPGSDDANVQLSGKLMLQYDWNGRDWVLRGIQNMTFRYTRRMMI